MYSTDPQSSVAQVTAPQLGAASQVAAPPVDSAYFTALQQSLQPGFDSQSNALAASEAARGVLSSGQGVHDFSTLAGDQNAAYAAAAAPMIQQGFQQQFTANQDNAAANNAVAQANAQYQYGASGQNAGAANSLNSLLQQQTYGAQQANASNALQANEFNSTQNYNLQSQNAGYQNALQMAQLGYGNQDYLAQLGDYAGLEQTSLGSLGSILGQGQGAQFQGYQAGSQLGSAAGSAQGYNQGYTGGNNTVSQTAPYYGGYEGSGGGYEGPGVGGFDYGESQTSGGG